MELYIDVLGPVLFNCPDCGPICKGPLSFHFCLRKRFSSSLEWKIPIGSMNKTSIDSTTENNDIMPGFETFHSSIFALPGMCDRELPFRLFVKSGYLR